ncbi:MAG TPA: type 2 lanthipeptide synthetase LanM family protein [Pseudonocardiaceae bacterium]
MNDSARSTTGFAGLLGPGWWALGLASRERPEAGLSAEALAERCAQPVWAGFIERAVSSDAEPLTGSGFAPVLAALVAVSVEELALEVADVDLDAIEAGFRSALSERLGQLAARTLVTELNVARVEGRLAGATGEERFADFVRYAGTGAGLAGLFTEYPVLARVLGTACLQSVDACHDIVARFVEDRALIVDRLLGGEDPGALLSVEPGSGDYHRRGRSVAVLRFASGARVVYKPRSLALQTHFDELVDWLNRAVPWLGLRTVESLPREDYGWQEFIDYRPCADVAEVESFYQRQGALLALINALDGTDIHHENLIAVADQPILIDIETLFHPTLLPHALTGPDPALRALMTSVHRTSMLPTLMVGENGALDLSGMGGDRDRTYPLDEVDWADAGTDRMRLVRGAAQFTGSSNRPRIGDADVAPEEHTNALTTGFRAAYDAIARGADELLADDGLIRRCAHDEIRIVVRPTRMYGTLLAESTHPDVLRDAADRDELFDLLTDDAAGPFPVALAPHEIDDLWAGDVPIFLGRPGSRQIRTSTGATVAGLLERTGIASVDVKITRMGEVDRRDQEWVIRAALACRAEPDEHTSGATLAASVAAVVPDPERLLSAACGIADKIVARAVHDEYRVNWLTLDQVDGRHWMLLPMGAGLGTGYSGVALFLAQLGSLTGISRYTDLARKAMRPIPLMIEAIGANPELARTIGCGGFLGLGGICYALARLANLLGDPDLLGWLERMVPLVGLADDGQATSVATGRAGGLATMLAVHAETGLAEAGALAGEFARGLAEPAEPVTGALPGDSLPTNGFQWGDTGVGWALLRFAARDGQPRDARYAKLGRAALDRDPGQAASVVEAQRDYGWCSGLSGRLLARAADHPIADDHPLLDLLANRPALRDMSLCHGELGVLDALTALGGRARGGAVRGTAFLLGTLERFGPSCGLPSGISGPSLLTGLAGIGYGLLRLGMSEQVPSVLLFESTFRSGKEILRKE